MEKYRKIKNGAVRIGMLGVGILGLYFYRKKCLPGYVGFVSYCVTCVSVYSLSIYIIEEEYKEDEDKDQAITSSTVFNIIDLNPEAMNNLTDTPKSKKEWGIARRIFLSEFKEETDKILANFPVVDECNTGKTKSKNIERIFIKLSDLALMNQNAPDEVLELLKKVSDKLGEIKGEAEEEITLRTSPMKLEMLDIELQTPVIKDSEIALTQYVKDIIHELQVGEVSLLIDSENSSRN